MDKKFIILTILVMCLFSLDLTSAFFTKSHNYFIARGFEDISSPITNLCRDKITIVMDGQTSTDVPVLHYFGDKRTSYLSTHTRASGFMSCMEEAGSDTDKKCYCYGNALHIIQDSFSHTEIGITSKYIKKYFSLNLIGHMTIEKNFEDKLFEIKKNDPLISSGKMDFYDKKTLDNLFVETGGDEKYLILLQEMSGLNMDADARLFRSGYLGEGFYNTVYKDKISLPFWAWGIGIGLIILGLGMTLFLIIFGKTKFRFIASILWIFLMVLGIILVFSFISGTTWKFTSFLISIPPKVGLLSISETDMNDYINKVQSATNEFLRTGIVNIDDATGLSFIDRNGVPVKGALNKAETTSKYIFLPIFGILFVWLNFWMIRKSFRKK